MQQTTITNSDSASDAPMTVQAIIEQAQKLSAPDKALLISSLAASLAAGGAVPATPRQSLRGICADLGPAPSAEEIDEARREAWGNWPRDEDWPVEDTK